MPHQRRLDHYKKTEAAKIIEIEVNKKLLQQYLKSNSGNVVTLKIMTEVQTEIHQSSDSNNLEILLQCLKGIEGI